MTGKIDHIGIAVTNLEAALPLYRDVLGMQFQGVEEVEDQKLRVAFLKVGESKIELLEPTSPESPVSRFLEKGGEGIHHIAYRVENLAEALDELKEKGIRLIDQTPRKGAHGTSIAFLHPRATGGVLTELCQANVA